MTMSVSEAVNSLDFYKRNWPDAVMFKFAEEHDIDLMTLAWDRPANNCSLESL
jgi:hypothetical protein